MEILKNSVDEIIGKVFRHKRLFNFLVSPIAYHDGVLECLAGKDSIKQIPIDFFKRDWKLDMDINPDEFIDKLAEYPSETPATIIFNDYFEKDDGKEHTYLYFDGDFEEEFETFPLWKIVVCDKNERDETINPFTIIMPLVDDRLEEIQKEVDLINELRMEHEFLDIPSYQEFEFALIKLLEKKYLREV